MVLIVLDLFDTVVVCTTLGIVCCFEKTYCDHVPQITCKAIKIFQYFKIPATYLSKEESCFVVARYKQYKLFPRGLKLLTALPKIVRYAKKFHFGEHTKGSAAANFAAFGY